MTNNTIPNVSRELLADLLGNDHDKRIMAERHLLAMLANAPSPASVDGLKRYEVFPYLDDDVAELDICESDDGSFVKYEDAQAIIDGLRGEVDKLMTTFVRVADHLHIDCEKAKSAPRKPSDVFIAAIDQQAQRIGELEWLLREAAASLAWNAHGECRAIHDGPIMPSQMALDAVKAALGGSL